MGKSREGERKLLTATGLVVYFAICNKLKNVQLYLPEFGVER